MKKIIIFLMISSMMINLVHGLDYYIDNSATGNDDGSSWGDAWQGFENINWSKISPGDVIYISGGAVNKTYISTLIIGKSGNLSNQITIHAGQDIDHSGTVIIRNDDIGIDFNGNDYITIDGGFNGAENIRIITLGPFGIYDEGNDCEILYCSVIQDDIIDINRIVEIINKWRSGLTDIKFLMDSVVIYKEGNINFHFTEISNEEALTLIGNCEIGSLDQTDSENVYIELNNGTEYYSVNQNPNEQFYDISTYQCCDDNNICTDDSYDDKLVCQNAFNMLDCDDGNPCTTGDTCNEGVCSGIVMDCSGNDIFGVDTCDDIPDDNPYTMDYRRAFTSSCSEGVCSVGGDTIIHTCDTTCGAGCLESNDCQATDCTSENRCVGDDYYDYTNVNNTCIDCQCTSNPCDDYIIIENSGLCIECQTDVDCSDLNDDYCDGDRVMNDAGRCIDYACVKQTAVVEDCDDMDNDYCDGTSLMTEDYTCRNAACSSVIETLDCDDGLFCNGAESCENNACAIGTSPDCDDGNSCTDDSCDPASGCVNTFNNAPCNDLDACSSDDVCSGGSCNGNKISCDDGEFCTDDSCDSSTGCVYGNNNAVCNDDNACTESDVCSGGSCSGQVMDCSGNDIIIVDTCDYDPDDNPYTMDFRNAFTSICSGGVCSEYEDTISHDCDYSCNAKCLYDNECPATDCYFESGCIGNDYHFYSDAPNTCVDCQCTDNICSDPAITFNSPQCTDCHDDDGCDYLDKDYCDENGNVLHDKSSCVDYSCIAETTTIEVCGNMNYLHCNGSKIMEKMHTCVAASCVVEFDTIVQNCDDMQWCNGEESCYSGACVQGIPPTIDDDVDCTDDSCDEVNDAIINSLNNANCDDGMPCSVGTCDAVGDCTYSYENCGCDSDDDCSKLDNDCNIGVCSNYECILRPSNEAGTCDDGEFCTTGETCSAGICTGGIQTDCSDGVTCTDDSCDEANDICVNTANDANCNDGTFCNGEETCDPVNDCQYGDVPICDDSVTCTSDFCDTLLDECVNHPDDDFCDDSLGCSLDTCDAVEDCIFDTLPCDCLDNDDCNHLDDACNEVISEQDCTPPTH